MSSDENLSASSTDDNFVAPNGAESRLLALVKAQEEATSTFPRKCLEFFKRAAVGYENPLEKFILETEPNDCTFVAKYSKVVDLDLRSCDCISVNSLTLHSVHTGHPLVNFAKEEPLSPELLKEVEESPALVFIHGLGGQMSQFEPLMGLLSQCSEIFALDLPGFGDSRYEFPSKHKFSAEHQKAISSSIQAMAWSDFKTDCIVAIVVQFIRQYIPQEKKIILIGHSMGTHISIKVASTLEEHKVEGLVLLSPPPLQSEEGTEWETHNTRLSLLKNIRHNAYLVNQFRVWDRLEGVSSQSVLRQLPENSSIYTKVRQLRWNMDVDTRVVLRYIDGFQKATYEELISAVSRYNDRKQDPSTYEKTLLIGGMNDRVTPVKVVDDIHEYLCAHTKRTVSHVTKVNNAGHSLLLAKPEFISGIILNHLESKFPERLHLSPAWVLKLKAEISGDKWGLKNELKWSQTQAVSFNITRRNNTDLAPLLGMKTLREGDPNHSPHVLEERFYGSSKENDIKGNLIAVVDISADIPPYSPKSFKHIHYYKCATVSKVVPDHTAVRRFIQLIDDILASTNEPNPLVGVHCHYGFNRTGYLICCYLIEKKGWSVREAVEGFKAAKSPGIKHPHFIDALYVRYES
ncbi:putative Abhydrolase domain-containing protein [Clavispora lusitaniae]|nr:hypothetical protein E0198_002062 [Clavispora lusitaniae]KAF7583916.1 Alpha/beta hydrolase family protein [Clavispora lusitaniae]OVF08898.1 putative triacylglycerol lipase [Clavispora lusitaniae]QFZ26117.1 putative Abhydrolase domain-containing protein [Clavispora lusitaniae]QFZ31785.1 putative Abhydrolase domain-containing protein [Clavispora lusitaniae]